MLGGISEVSGSVAKAARWAVLTVFFVNGFAIATWVAHVPSIKEKFRIDSATLGLVLLAAAVGAVTALLLSSRLVARFGSRRVTTVGTLGIGVAIALLILVPTLPLLILVLVFFGIFQGSMDVAMNAQAVAVESRLGRPLMSTFHAFFSLGGLAGAAVGSVLLSMGVTATAHVLGAALVLLIVSSAALRSLLPSSIDRARRGTPFVAPTGALLGLGLLALFALLSEGAVADWSAVYLRVGLGTDEGFAAAGFAAFSLTMGIGRLVGDWLRLRIPAVLLLRLSGALSAAGLGIALVIGQPIVALVGFGVFGLGLANVVPILFSAAGNTPGVTPGTGIAAVATAGYFGFLMGPPLIGFVAQGSTLGFGLGVIVIVTALIAVLGGVVGPASARSES